MAPSFLATAFLAVAAVPPSASWLRTAWPTHKVHLGDTPSPNASAVVERATRNTAVPGSAARTASVRFSDVSLVGERWTFPGAHDPATGKLLFSPPESPTVLRLSADIVLCSANITVMQSTDGGRRWLEHPDAKAGRIPDSATDHKGIPPSVRAAAGSRSLWVDVQPFRAFPCAVPNEQASPGPCTPTTRIESRPTEQDVDWGLTADGTQAAATVLNAQPPCGLAAPRGFVRDGLPGWWAAGLVIRPPESRSSA